MTTRRSLFLTAALFLAGALAGAAAEPKKVTYEDDALPIFRDNCFKCHNPDKLKGDLDLTSFSSALKGGGGGVDLNAGDPEGSQLFKSITHADEPTMPPNAKLPDKEIATIRAWIEGGLLQGANSKVIAANRPKVDLSLKSVSVTRPEGPPPMPRGLALDPFVHATHGSALSAIASSPWAPIVALAAAKQIVFYNTTDLEFIGVLPFPEGFPCDLKFSRNGKLLLASGGRGGKTGLAAVWDIATGERIITVGDQFDSVLAADLSSDQRWIALGGPDRVLKIYNTRDGSLEHRIKKHTEWVTAVEFSPDSKFLATGDRNGGVVLWDADGGQERFNLPGHKGAITAITWRGDSEMFLSASEDGTLRLWKAGDGTPLRRITAHAGGALSARFAEDGRIVSCGRDNKVQIWDTTGKNLRTLAFNGELPNRVTFSDDGTKVIGSDWQGSVFVWDAANGKVLGNLAANPPTLGERVQRGTQQIAKLQKEIEKSTGAQASLETAAKVARANADRLKKALADAQTSLAAGESPAEKAGSESAESASRETNPTSDTVGGAPSRVAALEKQAADATRQAAEAAKKASEAAATVRESRARMVAAKSSLARWQEALQSSSVRTPPGKVSMR